MKYKLLIFFLLRIPAIMFSQKDELITIKAGTKITDYFPYNKRFHYPEFVQGTIVFKTGNITNALMNYDKLAGEMLFISNRDTLSLANGKDISFVSVAMDTFYFDQGYLRVLAGKNPVYLAVKEYMKLIDTVKEGAYGTKSSTTAVDSYSQMLDGYNTYNLTINEDLIIAIKTDYFIGNNKEGFEQYRKSNLIKLFPDQKEAIEKYLKQNKVDFNKKDDLINLTVFLQQM